MVACDLAAFHRVERLWRRALMLSAIAFVAVTASAFLGDFLGHRDKVWIAFPIAIPILVVVVVVQILHHRAYIQLRLAEGLDRKTAVREYREKYPSD